MAGVDISAAKPIATGPADRSVWYIPSVLGFTLVLVLAATTFALPIKADDIWWHLRTGEFILTTWTIPDQNIFSYTAPEYAWLPHEWLSEVVFYAVYAGLGARGLIALGVLLNGLACALVYQLTARSSRSPYLAAIITLLAALMMLGNFSLRPYLFGNLFFILTLYAMEEPAAGGRLRPVWIFVLFTAWANFHGSFLIGLALIGLYLTAGLSAHLKPPRRSYAEVRALLVDLLVAGVACVVTPHHVYGFLFPLIYLHNAFSGKLSYLTNISEWQSAGFSSPLGRMITFYVMFCLFAIAGSGVTPAAVHVGLLLAFSFFAFATIRNIPLLGIAVTPVLARHLPRALLKGWRLMTRQMSSARLLERIHQRSLVLERRSAKLVLPLFAVVVWSFLFALPPSVPVSYSSLAGVRELADLSPAFYPRGLLAELKGRSDEGRVLNYFNWGGAFIWALYPQRRVFIDQRNDCYPLDVVVDYFAVHNLERGWRDVLDRWEIAYVAYPPRTRLADALRDDIDWLVVYEDDEAVLFYRQATEPAGAMACLVSGSGGGRRLLAGQEGLGLLDENRAGIR